MNSKAPDFDDVCTELMVSYAKLMKTRSLLAMIDPNAMKSQLLNVSDNLQKEARKLQILAETLQK